MLTYQPATPRQREALYRILGPACWARIPALSKAEAHAIIAAHAANWRSYPPTARQEWFLRQAGRWQPGLTRGEAFDRIAGIKGGGGGAAFEEGEPG